MELLLLLLPLLLLPWFGLERRAGRTVGRAGGAAGFAFRGNGAQKLSKACNFCFLLFAAPGKVVGHTGVRLCHVVWHGTGAMPLSAIKHLAANQQVGARVCRCWGGRCI